jgi:hypothetical protein
MLMMIIAAAASPTSGLFRHPPTGRSVFTGGPAASAAIARSTRARSAADAISEPRLRFSAAFSSGSSNEDGDWLDIVCDHAHPSQIAGGFDCRLTVSEMSGPRNPTYAHWSRGRMLPHADM